MLFIASAAIGLIVGLLSIPGTVSVVVARKRILAHEFITPEKVTIRQFLRGSEPDGALQEVDDIRMGSWAALREIRPGRPIANDDIKYFNPMWNSWESGYRLITLKVNFEKGAYPIELIGCRVDLLGEARSIEDPTLIVSRVFAQNLRVMQAEPAGPGQLLVTLAVKPDQAERLFFAQNRNIVMTLLIRKPGDEETTETQGHTERDPAAPVK
jgi:Flp pilus assembly protein CpaB